MSITKRIDGVTAIAEEYQKVILPAPTSVKIELTSFCNYSCGFCAHRLGVNKYGDMEWDFYKRIVNEMHEAGVKEIGMFYIGESLMCYWTPRAIRYAKTVGIPYVFLTTNGSLITPHKVDALMDAGLDSLKFSLNYASPEQFSEITGKPKNLFRQTIKNIKTTWGIREDSGAKTKLYASSILYDGEQREKMEEVVKEILPFVDEHYYLPLYSFGGQVGGLDFKPTAGNQGRIGALRQPLPCWSAFKEGHITSDGKMSVCCFGHGVDDCFILADLNKVSFMEGWNNKAFQEIRGAHLKKDVGGTICEKCLAYS